jgi:NADH:ubiquinone oxidoreductase subunit E
MAMQAREKIDARWQPVLEDVFVKFGKGRTSLLPALEAIQGISGYIPGEAAALLGKTYKLPVAEIYSVLSFYGMLSARKKGQYIIRVCSSLSCRINHSLDLVNTIQKVLDIKPGGTSQDNNITLEVVDCLGLCDQAPAMMVNEKTYGNLTLGTLQNIILTLKDAGQ